MRPRVVYVALCAPGIGGSARQDSESSRGLRARACRSRVSDNPDLRADDRDGARRRRQTQDVLPRVRWIRINVRGFQSELVRACTMARIAAGPGGQIAATSRVTGPVN